VPRAVTRSLSNADPRVSCSLPSYNEKVSDVIFINRLKIFAVEFVNEMVVVL
jgi:hypothetical protein